MTVGSPRTRFGLIGTSFQGRGSTTSLVERTHTSLSVDAISYAQTEEHSSSQQVLAVSDGLLCT